jgi:hypothetical protein
MDKRKAGFGLLFYKIADCERTDLRACAIGDPRGRLLVGATSQACNRR